jgi:2-oxoglutarate dehydrogenase E1 component
LYPFPQKELAAVLGKYGQAQEVYWVQEEPKNRGAWSFIAPRLTEMLPDRVIDYVGREESASPAAGSIKMHQMEEHEILTAALGARVHASVTAPGTPATAISATPVSK